MDALVTAFVAAGIAEWGDRTQLLVALLAARSGRPLPILIGLALAAALSCAVAAFAGTLIAGTITIRALTLLVAVALLFAGVAGLIPRKAPPTGSDRTPLIIAAFILCLAAEMGDRTQFLAFALAARFDASALAAVGATAGIVAACLPAAVLGARFQQLVPVRAIRIGGAILFLIAAFLVAIQGLQLV